MYLTIQSHVPIFPARILNTKAVSQRTRLGYSSRSLASTDEKPLPLFQLIARDHPPDCDDECRAGKSDHLR